MLSFTEFEDEDINRIENFSRSNLPLILDLAHNKCERRHLIYLFGQFSSKPEQFVFLPDEKELIHIIANHIKQNVMEFGKVNVSRIDHFGNIDNVSEIDIAFEKRLSQTSLGMIFTGDIEPSYLQLFCSAAKIYQNCEDDQSINTASETTTKIICDATQPISRTHQLLDKLKAIADQNSIRKRAGYRYDIDIKRLATYIRVLGGALLYETIHRNLELALPSIDTTNRFIRKMHGQMVEGCLRTNELLQYLTERKLPLSVALSEDATRITGRVEYDHRTNQVSGFVLPINKNTGMPIPYSFPARNRDEILKYFASCTPLANFVNVIMARPLANYPPFCLLLYSSDGKYSSEDVDKRWMFIVAELAKVNIKVPTISSDSDPRYNSSMRKRSKLGIKSDIFGDVEWFSSGLSEFYEGPFCVQDHIHNVTKERNLFLRTGKRPGKLPFGPNFFVKMNHLQFLLQHFEKDKHELTASTLDPVDKQNFSSAMRMCSDKVIQLLKKSLPTSVGTVKYLEIMRAVFDSYCDPKLSPLERVEKIWYAVFLLRIWRIFVTKRKRLTLKDNFLTPLSYTCIEINAHSLIQIMLYMKSNNLEHWFLPFIFDSQACEGFFRQIRSLTSVYSTVANCSTKEIIARINKIQLLNDITHKTEFSFPRVKDKMDFPGQISVLPTKEDIFNKIVECKTKAIEFALDIGMISDEFDYDDDLDLPCEIKSIDFKINNGDGRDSTETVNQNLLETIARMRALASVTTLKNYAKNFTEKEISESSSFVEIYNDGKKRIVVKKSSLIWLLRGDSGKLSSDRILRVRGATTKTLLATNTRKDEKKLNEKIQWNKTKKKIVKKESRSKRMKNKHCIQLKY